MCVCVCVWEKKMYFMAQNVVYFGELHGSLRRMCILLLLGVYGCQFYPVD